MVENNRGWANFFGDSLDEKQNLLKRMIETLVSMKNDLMNSI